MSLVMRKTGLHSPACAHWVDYTIYEDGRAIGRIYEEGAAPPNLGWYWCITVIGARHAGIRTDGRVATLDEATRVRGAKKETEAAVIRHFKSGQLYLK